MDGGSERVGGGPRSLSQEGEVGPDSDQLLSSCWGMGMCTRPDESAPACRDLSLLPSPPLPQGVGAENTPGLGAGGLPLASSPGSLSAPNLHLLTYETGMA